MAEPFGEPTVGGTPVGPSLADERAEPLIRSSELAFEGRVWDIRRETFEFAGAPVTRDFMHHPGAVGVLALDRDDRAMLIRQYRHPVRLNDWEIPAGLLDVVGEDPLLAAQRELAEEADLEAAEWAVLADIHTSPGGSDEAIRIYLARELRGTPSRYERTEEEAELVTAWIPLDDCVDAVLDRRVSNAPLAVAVLAAAASRARGWASLAPADAPWDSKPGREAAGA